MPRFFIKKDDVQSDKVVITGDDANHIKKVLRLECGDSIILCDGVGNDYAAYIEKFESSNVIACIKSVSKNETEPPVNITLFQGIPKSDKMDFIIQKGIELGVHKIVPVITERTVIRFSTKKDAEAKVTRWQRISLEAAKQCNRGIIPSVETPMRFEEALELSKKSEFSILPYEKESGNILKNCIKSIKINDRINDIAIFIGPEGGFSENEVHKAGLFGVVPVTLGPRILRTETAGIVVVSILMYELGDVG